MRRLNLPEEEIVRLYVAGDTTVSLAERYGCSRIPITRILEAAGVLRSVSDDNARRYRSMDDGQKKAQVLAANVAKRGRRRSKRTNEAIASSKQGKPRSRHEREVSDALAMLAIPHVVNLALGERNADIALTEVGLIAELDGGQWHGTAVKTADDSALEAAAIAAGYRIVRYRGNVLKYPEAIALDIQSLSRDPSPFGTERVIWRWVRDLPGRPAHRNQITVKRSREPAQNPPGAPIVGDHLGPRS